MSRTGVIAIQQPRPIVRGEDHARLLVDTVSLQSINDLPDAPVQVFPLEEDDVDPDDAVFSWEPVADPPGSEIDSYQVVVECEEPGSEMAVEVSAEITEITVPPQVLEDQDECKWEVLAVEERGNKTISESEFGIE